MKCPKYIINALKRRADCASKFIHYDCIIGEFLDKHNIEVEEYDIYGGCESYVNPDDSAARIYEAIIAR